MLRQIYLISLIFCFNITYTASAQEVTPDTSGIQYGKTYEIKLKAPIKCIQRIEYDKTGEEPKWKLSEDNKTIYISDYIINTKVKIKVVYETGKEEEYMQSPCTVKLSASEPVL